MNIHAVESNFHSFALFNYPPALMKLFFFVFALLFQSIITSG